MCKCKCITEQTDVIEDSIPEHLQYTIQGELGKVVVNADVKLPDAYKKCKIVDDAINLQIIKKFVL